MEQRLALTGQPRYACGDFLLFIQTLQSNLKPHNVYGFASKDDSSECSLDSFWFLHIFFVNFVRKLVIVSILPNLISKTELRDETGDP